MNYSQIANANNGLALNILEIIPSKDAIQIFKTENKTKSIKDYLIEYPEYYFYSEGLTVYAWNIVDNSQSALSADFKPVTISLKENTLVINKVLEIGIYQWFKNNKSTIYRLKYSSVYEVEFKKNIQSFNGLNIIPILNFGLHPFYSKQTDKQVIGLSLRYSTKFAFDTNETIFQNLKFDTRGLKRNYRNQIIASTSAIAKFLGATNQTANFNAHRNKLNTETNLYNELQNFIKIFNGSIKPNVFLPDGLTISELNFHNIPNLNFVADLAKKPDYFFYQERLGKGGYYNVLTKELKPYSFDFFNNRTVDFLVITPDVHEGTTETFIKNLEVKLKDVFHLYKVHFDYQTFGINSESYEQAIGKISNLNYDLAIVTVSANDKVTPIQSSPYYISKAKLLNQRIPTQEITVEIMRKADNMILDAIALNIYSKIGGSAWTIEKVQKQKTEVVIGISSTINFDNERVIGFANIFDYNGNYLIGDCSTISNLTNYASDLENHLTNSINALIEQKGLQTTDPVRLIFHLSKEAAKKYELKAIDNTLEKFKDYDIQFGIVHLSYNHNLRVFLNNGTDIPQRGTFIQISTFQALLHLGKGTKVPILVRLDQRSTYKDIFDASKQVLYFCHLCYRNFRPANVPVTIKYPSLMAKLSDELSQVPKWDTNQMNNIKDKLWFI